MKSTVHPAASAAPDQRLPLVLAFLAFVLIGANDGAFGVLLPSIAARYQLSTAGVSWLFFAGTTGYMVAAFTSGPLVDRLGQRRALVLGPLVLLAAFGALSTLPPLALLALCVAVAGFGVALVDAGLNAFVAALPRHAVLLNYLHACYGVGALLGPLVAAAFLLGGAWQRIYLVWALAAALVSAGLALALPAVARVPATGGRSLLRATLRLPVVWLAALFLLLYVGAEVSLGNWGFSLLTIERGYGITLASRAISGYWLGLTLGRVVLVQLVDRLGIRRLIQLCLAGVVVGVALVWWGASWPATIAGLWLAGFALGPIFPSVIALMPSLVSDRLLATAIGFLASFGSMGAALFPWLAGQLAAQLGLWALLPYVAALTVMMLAAWLALGRLRA